MIITTTYTMAGIFEDDREALVYVAETALAGSAYHAAALVLHALCDELRRQEWGDAYVTSRIGPP